MRFAGYLTLGAFFSALLAGCQTVQTPADLPALHPVSISVIQDGKPLGAASVTLYAEGSKWAVGGSTDNSGHALIRTLGRFPGAPVGTYKVCVLKEVIEGGGMRSDDPSDGSMPTTYYDLVAQQFKYPTTTPLEITVIAGQNPPVIVDVGKGIKKRLRSPN